MTTYNSTTPLWDLALPPALPNLADDEFLALLQTQFGTSSDNATQKQRTPRPSSSRNIDPQSLNQLSLSGNTPPLSDDSSPSPTSFHDNPHSRRHSGAYGDGFSGMRSQQHDEDAALKRKASDDEMDDEPNPKSQNTTGSPKKGFSVRRKSSGAPGAVPKDESRLMKRKEQNRAAQRAFRERKEKHVKDLEDKVAALEEKNSSASAENETLREVIARLQNENMRLRESSFTFSVPGPSTISQSQRDIATRPVESPPTNPSNSPPSLYASGMTSDCSSATASTQASPQSLFMNDKNEPISFFGPDQQLTATSDAMGMDFGFGPVLTETPYTTIASNPLFMSFREPTPFNMPLDGAFSSASPGTFDFSSHNMSGWPDITMQDTQAFDLTNSLDELFGASPTGQQGPIDYSGFKRSPSSSLSPVSHQGRPSPRSPSSSATSSSQTSASPHISGSPNPNSNGQTKNTASQNQPPRNDRCPITKAEFADRIHLEGPSTFAPKLGLPCETTLPKTQKSENNVEIMNAWRSITNDPKLKSVDVSELCMEFAAKARCDGSQVVIEPSGMQHILQSMEKKAQQQQQQQNQRIH